MLMTPNNNRPNIEIRPISDRSMCPSCHRGLTPESPLTMTTNSKDETTTLSPDEAFAVLGKETRMEVLKVLGDAEEPLSFSEIRERLGIDDPGQVNYHLKQLRGHFIQQTEDGYNLLEPGNRIIQAVVSGSVTGTSILEATPIDAPCPYCGEPVIIRYGGERLLVRCTDCAGTYAGSETDAPFVDAHPYGSIAAFPLPPAGFAGLSPQEVLGTAIVCSFTEYLAMGKGMCPRCAMAIEQTVQICDNHEPSGGNCERCHTRHAVTVDYHCPHCTHQEITVPVGFDLFLSEPELMTFLSARGVIPAIPSWELTVPMFDYEDEVIEGDPLILQLTYTVGGDRLVLTVDEELDVVDSNVITGLREEAD